MPPHDLDAEESLLGAMLLTSEAISCASYLSASDFYKPAHPEIFEAALSVHRRAEPADPVTVAAELRRRNTLDSVGGKAALDYLAANSPTIGSAWAYARIVAEHSRLRGMIAEARAAIDAAYRTQAR